MANAVAYWTVASLPHECASQAGQTTVICKSKMDITTVDAGTIADILSSVWTKIHRMNLDKTKVAVESNNRKHSDASKMKFRKAVLT